MFHLSARIWVSVFDAPKLFPRGQTFGAKSAKKCCHIGTLEAFHLWSLVTSVKAQRSTSRSPPITLLDFLHLSIDRPSVKTSLDRAVGGGVGQEWGECAKLQVESATWTTMARVFRAAYTKLLVSWQGLFVSHGRCCNSTYVAFAGATLVPMHACFFRFFFLH